MYGGNTRAVKTGKKNKKNIYIYAVQQKWLIAYL